MYKYSITLFYQVEENRKFRVHIQGEKMFVSAYQRMRSIFERVNLVKGRYVILPSIREPGHSARFLLRMYTTSNASARELIQDCPKKGFLPCIKGYSVVTRISVKGADGLQSLKDPNARMYLIKGSSWPPQPHPLPTHQLQHPPTQTPSRKIFSVCSIGLCPG